MIRCCSLLFIVSLFAIMVVVTGCSRKIYVPVESTRTIRDSVTDIRYIHDSISTVDSVLIYAKGDTVFRDRIRYRDRVNIRTDTVVKIHHDTIPVVNTVEVEKPPSALSKIFPPISAIFSIILNVFFFTLLIVLGYRFYVLSKK